MSEFRFEAPRETAVLVCRHVWEDGLPVVHVCREEGDWQFLCERDHGEGSGEEPVMVCLGDLVDRDPTLNGVADLCGHESARRISPGEPWAVHDDMEDHVRANVEEHGWHVMLVPGGEEPDEPAFAYTIGLWHSFQHPELICFGLPDEVAAGALNNCGDEVEAGRELGEGSRSDEAFDGLECAFREFPRAAYRDHLGYAVWFYDGAEFPVLQCIWPDREGRFPWEEGCDEEVVLRQPFVRRLSETE